MMQLLWIPLILAFLTGGDWMNVLIEFLEGFV
jgi:hypothetical protein